MITPASTLHDLIEGRALGSPPIRDILAELPTPKPYFQTPVSLSPIPAMVVPGTTTTSQGSGEPVIDTVEAEDSNDTAGRRLSNLLRGKKNSNVKVNIYSDPSDGMRHAARVIAKHLRPVKPTVETLPALALHGSEPKEPTEKCRSRILGAIETMLNDATQTNSE